MKTTYDAPVKVHRISDDIDEKGYRHGTILIGFHADVTLDDKTHADLTVCPNGTIAIHFDEDAEDVRYQVDGTDMVQTFCIAREHAK